MPIKSRELLIEYKSKGSCLVTVHSLRGLNYALLWLDISTG